MELIAGLLGSFGGIGGYILAAIAAVAAIFGYGAIKKQQGKSAADAANETANAERIAQRNTAVVEKQIETMKGTSDAQNEVTGLPTGVAERELREHWQRKDGGTIDR